MAASLRKLRLLVVVFDLLCVEHEPKQCRIYFVRESAWKGASEQRRVPNSTFNKDALVLAQRCRVTTKVIRCRQWNQKAQDCIYADTYDWVTATPVAPKAKLAALTSKQRKLIEELAAKPLADGSLFGW